MSLRAFIAVDPSEEVTRRLAEAVRMLERKTSGFRWVRPEAIHLTLRFLGEIEEASVDEINRRLAERLVSHEAITLTAEGLGFFPGPEKPRVVWAGLQGQLDRLIALQKAVQESVRGLAVHKEEERDFAPHLTLARIPNFKGASGVSEILKVSPALRFGEFTVERVFLYKSRLTPEGASYTKLREYRLKVNGNQ